MQYHIRSKTSSATRRRATTFAFSHRPLFPSSRLSTRELRACLLGSHLFACCLQIMALAAFTGAWVCLEHPVDRGREPYASFFHRGEMDEYLAAVGGRITLLHQCRFGGIAVKPTNHAVNDIRLGEPARRCNHKRGHPCAIGRAASGGFFKTPLARYPPLMCEALADRLMQLVLTRGERPSPGAHGEEAARVRGARASWARWQFPIELAAHRGPSLLGGESTASAVRSRPGAAATLTCPRRTTRTTPWLTASLISARPLNLARATRLVPRSSPRCPVCIPGITIALPGYVWTRGAVVTPWPRLLRCHPSSP